MRNIEILVTSDLPGGTAPFEHGGIRADFYRLTRPSELPLLEGTVLAFVDWFTPEMSGLELCRQLRCAPLTAQSHITIVLAEDDIEDRRRALRAGADDYIVGPINRTRLLDRVLSSVQKDYHSGLLQPLIFGDLTIDIAAFRARWRGAAIDLMPNEFRLLRFFVEHPQRIFTRAQLIAALGKQDPPIDERTVDVWIGRLRRALLAAGAGSPLRTVRSIGYILDKP